MEGSFGRRFGAILFACAMQLIIPATVAATISGGCEGTGSSSSGGPIDLTTATVWHLQSTETASGSGTAPTEQKAASVSAYALGLGLPIAAGSGDGDTAGSVEGVSVSFYSTLGRRFVVAGSSDTCSGEIEIIIDDVNPLLTVLGGGGLAVGILGLVLVLLSARMGSGFATSLMAMIFGGLGGIGFALFLEQMGVLDPRSYLGLGIGALGVLLGFILGGRFGPRPMTVA
jgi:hypothetical protein